MLQRCANNDPAGRDDRNACLPDKFKWFAKPEKRALMPCECPALLCPDTARCCESKNVTAGGQLLYVLANERTIDRPLAATLALAQTGGPTG